MSGIDNYREVRLDIDGFKTLQDSAGKVLYLRKSKHIHQSCEQIVIPTWNCKYLFLNGPSDFHGICDDKGATVTVVKSSDWLHLWSIQC